MLVNAVFEGGGVKAVGLIGALSVAEQRGFKFHHVAGTSSGAIVASFIAAGYTADEMRIMLRDTPFTSFLRKSWMHRMSVFGPAVRLFVKKGLYSGEALEYWVRQKLSAKGIRTFADMEPNKLRIIASDISQGRLLVLPDDIAQYGMDPARLEVAKAVRMSTSIPYFFDPVMIRKPVSRKIAQTSFAEQFIYVVDGALLSNFPLWIFDKEMKDEKNSLPTLGFQLVGRHANTPRTIRGPLTMFQALFATMMEAHDERYIEEHNRFRTIKIPTLGVQTTQFDLSQEMSEKLYESGRTAARAFFDKWSLSSYVSKFKEWHQAV